MPKFKRDYKRLDQRNKNRVDHAVREMSSSEDPTDLGTYKKQFGVFAYEIGQKYRIIYTLHRDIKAIELTAVCDHKSVYGRG